MGTLSPQEERNMLLGCLGIVIAGVVVIAALAFSAWRLFDWLIR